MNKIIYNALLFLLSTVFISSNLTFASNNIPLQQMGVTYNGLHQTTSPTQAQVNGDARIIYNYGFQTVRTYYPQYHGGNVNVMSAIEQNNLKVLLGLYIHENHEWTEGDYNNFVKKSFGKPALLGVLVGNEDFKVHHATINEFIDKIKNGSSSTPVSTAQTSSFWLGHETYISANDLQKLADKCDFIAVNIYPSWEWKVPNSENQPQKAGKAVTPEDGLESFNKTYNEIKAKYPGKQIVVTETGWPTTYGWIVNAPTPKQCQVGLDNAKKYQELVKQWAQDNNVVVFYYAMFDSIYGIDGDASQYNMHFGIKDAKGDSKSASGC
jgi:exo-beta-1,3-glucanase (GH17 family)